MSRKNDIKSLTDLRDGETGIIVSIAGGRNVVKRLADLGLATGMPISVISRTFFSGPVQIEVSGSRLVIGRGMASRITVEVI